MTQKDSLQRFLFDDTDVRGELVQLEASYQDAFQHVSYPKPFKHLLGEAMSAAILMTATLKFSGKLSIQLQGDGALTLLLVQATHQQKLRGLIKWKSDPGEKNFREMVGKGQFAITIEPDEGNRYQGVVPLDGDSLAQCLEHYFIQSEQLPTRMWLAANDEKTAGLLLQQLPSQNKPTGESDQNWDHLSILSETITSDELLDLSKTELLYRLYHQEKTRVFGEHQVEFQCTCSRDRCEGVIVGLGKDEIQDMISQEKHTNINCEFCNAEYTFNHADLNRLLEIATNPT